MLIAMLCIDLRSLLRWKKIIENGVMKAIGIHNKDIQNYIYNKIYCDFSWWMYMWIYTLTICYKIFTSNITLYMGAANKAFYTILCHS